MAEPTTHPGVRVFTRRLIIRALREISGGSDPVFLPAAAAVCAPALLANLVAALILGQRLTAQQTNPTFTSSLILGQRLIAQQTNPTVTGVLV